MRTPKSQNKKTRSKKLDEKFVCLLKDNSCLWDRNDKDYRNTSVKERVWKDVAEQMSLPVSKCRNNYRVIRERYRNEMKGKPVAKGSESVIMQLDFLSKSFKKLPNPNNPDASATDTANTTTTAKSKAFNFDFTTFRTLRSTTPTVQLTDPIVDPLFLDVGQLSNTSLKNEDFPRDVTAMEFLNPVEITTDSPEETAEKVEQFEDVSMASVKTKVAQKETDNPVIPPIPPIQQQHKKTHSKKLDEKFVCLLKDNSCLWDRNDKDYRNTSVKERAWEDVAEQMCLPVSECRNNYRVIRERYRNEMKGKPVAKGSESVMKQLDFLSKSFKKLPNPNTSDAPATDTANTTSTAKPNAMTHFKMTFRSLQSTTPTVHLTDPIVDPLFLDVGQLSNTSLKIEDFPRDLTAVRILDPEEVTMTEPQEIAEKEEHFEDASMASVKIKVARKETDNPVIPPIPLIPSIPPIQQQFSQNNYQPSGFALAIDEKLKLLPPREKNRLEKKIFIMVADEVDKMF